MSSGNIYDAESYLDFRNLQFYDRGDDIASLTQAYEQSFNSSRPQIVWLKGHPGVGKSALVDHVFLSKDYYCAGTFERLRSSMPYSALTQLLGKLCYALEFEDIQIPRLSASDEAILSQLFPEVLVVLAPSTPENEDDNPQDGVALASSRKPEWGLELLKHALSTFLKAVSRVLESPLILFLDDLQWADQDTLELLQDLLIDDRETVQHQGNGILFIGAYRDNEVQENSHPLAQSIQTISQHIQQEPACRISELLITNLNVKTTIQLVADLTSSKPHEVAELGKLVFTKTDGNCFYLLHAMRHIHQKKLLYRSTVTMRWEWDTATIREEVQVSDNIAEFMAQKLKQLPQPTLDALTLAAFLGTKVEIEFLRSLLAIIMPESPPLVKVLQAALDANLIEMTCSRRKVFKFTHDRVTDAAYNMIPEETARQELHLRIGWHLHGLIAANVNEDDLSMGNDTSNTSTTYDAKHWQLILAVDQLNRGAALLRDKREQVLVAKLDLVAAQQVLQTGAFKVATGFLESGLSLLGFLPWRMSYDLTLQLSITLASVLYSNGRMEQSLTLIDEILENAACPEDKYEAKSIQLSVLESTGQFEKCMQIGIATLAELGHPKIPKKPHLGHMVVGVVVAQKALRRMSDEDILGLPVCTDPKRTFVMSQLSILCSIAYHSCSQEMMILMAYRVLQMSLRCGITKYSAYSFCCHAAALGGMGKFDEATRFAELSAKLMKRFPTEDFRASSFARGGLHHMKRPIHECINSTLQTYHASFSKGDLGSAGLCCLMHISHRTIAGLSLGSIAKDAVGFCHQLKKYQQTLMLKYLLQILRSVLQLLGRTDEISSFVENGNDDQKFESFVTDDGDKNGKNDFWLLNMATQFRLGNPESALQFAEKSWRLKGPSGGIFVFSPVSLFFSALTAIQAWKTRRNCRHWRLFRKFHKELGAWVEKGNLNTGHLVLLLDAELAVVKKQRPDKIRSMFESSISLASRCGFVHDAALANERAGQYCIQAKDMYWAEHYLTSAHELYTDWTATAKVKQMEATYKRFIIAVDDQKSAIISCANTKASRRTSNVSLTGRSRLAVVAQVEAKRESFGRSMGPSTRMMGTHARMPRKLSARRMIAKGA